MPISGPTSDPGVGTAGSAAQLPTGTVTFVMTDIEGSTRLLQALGDRYPQLLADHYRLLREAFSSTGVEVRSEGDALFYVFVDAATERAGSTRPIAHPQRRIARDCRLNGGTAGLKSERSQTMTDTIDDVAARAAGKEPVEPALDEQSVAEQLVAQAREGHRAGRPAWAAQPVDQAGLGDRAGGGDE